MLKCVCVCVLGAPSVFSGVYLQLLSCTSIYSLYLDGIASNYDLIPFSKFDVEEGKAAFDS